VSGERPGLDLYRSPDGVWLDLGPRTVPGDVERVDVLDGALTVSTTRFTPAVDVGGRSARLDLTPWPGTPAEPTVLIFYRRRQPGCRGLVPLARAAFRLDQNDIKEPVMTHPETAEDSPISESEGPTVGVSTTIDFGTSRTVGAVYDVRAVFYEPRKLPEEGLRRAARAGGFEYDEAGDRALQIEAKTSFDPFVRAEAWREVLGGPPLARNHLTVTGALSSDIVVTDDGVDFADKVVGQSQRIRGIKRYLADLDRRVPGTEMIGRELFPLVYRRFFDLIVQELDLPAPPLWLNVTFPTRLPPDRRDALLEVLRQEFTSEIDMHIDEAAAAAGFYLLKRFGNDSVLGVEAFRLHARCPEGFRAWDRPDIWDAAREWHENLLVIDVGGGTTDCALVKVVVADVSPSGAGRVSPGHYYRLQPRVIASGGRLHLGGDLLTLAIYTLLKDRYGLAEGATKFAGVEDDLRAERQAAFEALWTAAEQVKKRGLRDDQPRRVDVVFGSGTGSDRNTVYVAVKKLVSEHGDETKERRIAITAEDLAAVVDEVALRVAALATGIAAGGLHTLRPAEGEDAPYAEQAVDAVLLSGGSMLGEALRTRLESALRERFTRDGLDPGFDLHFDDVYCKTGTVLGGMYLNALSELSPNPEDPEVVAELLAGGSYFGVDVSRLHTNLAADFYPHRDIEGANWSKPAFRRGDALTGHGSAAYASSGSYSVIPHIYLHRFDVSPIADTGGRGTTGSTATVWAEYTMAKETADALADPAHGATMRFEIDQDERITLVIGRGTPRPVLDDVPPAKLVEGAPEGLVRDRVSVRDLCTDVVRAGIGVVKPRDYVLRAGTPLGPGGSVMPVSGRRLYAGVPAAEDPTGDATPRFDLLFAIPAGHHWLSIDESGVLRTHKERPQPRTVNSPEELLTAEEGVVFRRRLNSPSHFDEEKDPFNGER
jgi:hypothetical protein